MKIIARLKRRFRPWIYPLEDVLGLLHEHPFHSALDIGAGTGFLLENLERSFPTVQLKGTEVNPSCFRADAKGLSIQDSSKIEGRFDLLIFSDVLHHVPDKLTFLSDHIARFLNPGGLVLVKEMRPQNIAFRAFNRLHDLIFSGEFVSEISEHELDRALQGEFTAIGRRRKLILLYDHYAVLFRHTTETSLPPTSKTMSTKGIKEYK